jgi:glycosyltransferase involved in cell wall biosynthesis
MGATDLTTMKGLDGLRGKTLLIFDDGLATRDGHWLEYDKTLAAIHAELGVKTTIVCDRAFAHAAELEAMGVTVLPLVSQSPWRDFVAGRAPNVPWRALTLGWHFRKALGRALGDQAYDCVLMPATMSPQVMAWCLMPERLRRRAARVVFATWVSFASYRDGEPRFARRLIHWKAIGWWLRGQFASGKLAFRTDSARLAKEYRVLGGIPASPMASPVAVTEAARPPRDPAAPVCFGSLGPARMEKGIDLLQAAVEQVLAADHDHRARFIIQWNRAVPDGAGGELAPSPALLADPRVRLITQSLSSAEYQALLGEIDCMVMPYRRSAYYSRGSAVVVEAACAAMPVIHTADSWLSTFIAEQGAGPAVADGDADALAAAMLDVASRFGEYRDQAVARSAIALEMNSAESFVRALWGIDA